MVHAVRHRGVTLYQQIEYITPFAERQEVIMAKNRTYSGSRQSVCTPTLNKNNYMQLFRTIRKAREESASIKTARTEVQPIAKDA